MIFLVELGVHDGTQASTIYVDTDGITSGSLDTPADQYYMPRLSAETGAGSIERSMFSSSGGVTTSGPSQVGFGNISVVNGTPYGGPELIDDWIDLSFRTITIKSLTNASQEFNQNITRFVGTVEQLVSTNALDGFDLIIHDRLADFDKPLLVNKYLGTTISGGLGTVEGNADLKDQIRPKLWGTNHNVACIAVNPFDLVFQVSDGPVNQIIVYDGGVALTNDGDVGNLAALFAAVILPGHYVTCLALGLFRLGGPAAGGLTADVTEGATAALRTAGQIAARMVAWHQAMYPSLAVSLDTASVTALDALNDAECGISVSGEESALSAIMRVLNSIGAWMLPVSASPSVFEVGRFTSPIGPSVATYDLEDNLGGNPERIESGDQGNGVPAYKVIIKYDHLDIVQRGDDLFGVVVDNDPTRAAYLGEEWRQAVAQNTALLTQYPNAPEITIETGLVAQAEAEAEAARVLALHSVRRDIYRIKVPMSIDPDDDPGIGEVVELISRTGRMGLGTEAGEGKLFVVVARGDDFGAFPMLTLTLWG